METTKYGKLKDLCLYGKFAFRSIDEVCWEYQQSTNMNIILYMPLNNIKNDCAYHCFTQYKTLVCNFEFADTGKKLLLEGQILKSGRLLVKIEQDGVQNTLLLVRLNEKESSRFLQFLSWGKTQTMEISQQQIREIRMRAKRCDDRINKKFPITYSVTVPKMQIEKQGRPCVNTEVVEIRGETANVSKSGLFIKSEFLPPLDAKIKVHMVNHGKVFEGYGRVVRRIDSPGKSGFGVELIKDDVKNMPLFSQMYK